MNPTRSIADDELDRRQSNTLPMRRRSSVGSASPPQRAVSTGADLVNCVVDAGDVDRTSLVRSFAQSAINFVE